MIMRGSMDGYSEAVREWCPEPLLTRSSARDGKGLVAIMLPHHSDIAARAR